MSQLTRFGLSEPNFRRFEPIIHQAVLSYPQPVTINWSSSDLRYSTYVGRLRDAILALKQNPSWAGWLTPQRLPILTSLVLRPHPTNPSLLLLGEHSLTKPPPPVQNVGEALPYLPEIPHFAPGPVVPGADPTSPRPDALSSKPLALRLEDGLDLTLIERAVKAYALLASLGTRYGEAEVSKSVVDRVTLDSWLDGYDVAIRETDNTFVIF